MSPAKKPTLVDVSAPDAGRIDPLYLDLAERIRGLEARERELSHRVLDLETKLLAARITELERATPAAPVAPPVPTAPSQSRAEFKAREKARIEEALKNARFNKGEAARALGYARRTFFRRLKELGIE